MFCSVVEKCDIKRFHKKLYVYIYYILIGRVTLFAASEIMYFGVTIIVKAM